MLLVIIVTVIVVVHCCVLQLPQNYLLKNLIYIYIYIVSKVDDHSQQQPKSSLFNSYHTEV